jgi:hypothetical protein
MPYPLPGEQIPIISGPNGEPIVPAIGPTPVGPIIPPKKTPGRLLFDKFNNGETKFTSLKYTDARDGFNKQIKDEPLLARAIPDGYIGTAPDEKIAASNHKVRIANFLKTPRGQKFVIKQVGLQLSNTRIESLDLFSTTANNITKKLGLGSLGDGLGGIGNISISPSTILSAVNFIKDTQNKKINESDILNGIGIVARKQTRSAISALQNYNIQNTIDQAGTDPNTGWNHFDRFGATNIMSDNEKYWYIVRKNNGSEDFSPTESPSNRLVKLRNELGAGIASSDYISDLADNITNGRFGIKAVRNFTNDVKSYYNQGLGLFNALGNDNQAKDFQPINQGISDTFNFFDTRLAMVDKFVAPFTNNIIDQYEGGPNSLNGIGPTIIKRYDNTDDKTRKNKIIRLTSNSLNSSRNLLTGEKSNQEYNGTTPISKQYKNDTQEDTFIGVRNEISNNVYGKTPNYNTVRTINIPKSRKSVGKIILDETNKTYDYGTESHSPKIIEPFNKKLIDYHYFDSTGKFKVFDRFEPISIDEKKVENASINRVVFTPINPFTGKPFLDPDLANGQPDLNAGRIFFDAYISNFKDNFTPTWNDINYIGRSETFHVFTKFKRDISFTLQIPCFNPKQLRNRHRALYELASINAGSYYDPLQNTSGGDQKLGGVITYLRLGNYLAPGFSTPNGNGSEWQITGEPGIITNFSITIPNDTSWDIDQQLAHYLTVDVGFKLIHNVRPQRQRGGFISGIGEYFEYKELDEATKQSIIAEEARAKAREETQKQAQTGGDFRKSINDAQTMGPKFKSYIPKVRKNGVVDEPIKSRYMEAKEQVTGISSEDGVFSNSNDDGEGDF